MYIYKTVMSNRTDELDQKVNDLIRQGWQIYGKLEISSAATDHNCYRTYVRTLRKIVDDDQ